MNILDVVVMKKNIINGNTISFLKKKLLRNGTAFLNNLFINN